MAARTSAKVNAPKAKAKAKAPAKKPAPRADLGSPIDGFFAKHPPPLRATLERLRALVEETVPGASGTIKWGQPFFTIDGQMFCALGGHKAHVNLILAGPEGTFSDPAGHLVGEGKTGRHMKLRSVDEIPVASVRRWLRAAAALARKKGKSAR